MLKQLQINGENILKTMGKIKIQQFRTNDLVDDNGKQIEFGKTWTESFFKVDSSVDEVILNLTFKAITLDTVDFDGKSIILKLAGVTGRSDRKAYANGNNGRSQLKDFFLSDLGLSVVDNNSDYFALYQVNDRDYFLYYIPNLLYNNFIKFFESSNTEVSVSRTRPESFVGKDAVLPLQQIFYGAPGTGKSYKVKEITEEAYYDEEEREKFVFRTTFHPDYDYASFVGCYKPTEAGDKITYSFVPQVFTKAYIKAWMEMKNNCNPRFFETKYGKYTIDSIDDDKVGVTKEESCWKSLVSRFWEQAWGSGSFEPKIITSHSISKAICWQINELIKANDFDNGWTALVDKISNSNGKKLELNPFNQKYIIEQGENEDTLKITTTQNSYKEAINNEFENIESGDSTAGGLANLLKKYNKSDFADAWDKLKTAVDNSNSSIGQKPNSVYLVIEEINRGNCAQIFGDLFQLLDRKKDGYSEYPIDADEDLKKCLVKELGEDNGGIKDGKLCLPPNLNILATMNTSDQSLFPMDSAFKRRWDWEYVPIRYSEKEANGTDTFHKFIIKIGDKEEYLWTKFLKQINEKILEVTESEDKQIGEYFVKPADGYVITEKQFVNKVMFYLWNDIFKDEYKTNRNHFRYNKNDKKVDTIEFSFNDLFGDKVVVEDKLKGFMDYLGVNNLKEGLGQDSETVQE